VLGGERPRQELDIPVYSPYRYGMNRHQPGTAQYKFVRTQIYKVLVGLAALAAFHAWSTYYLWDAPRWSKGYYVWWASVLGRPTCYPFYYLGQIQAGSSRENLNLPVRRVRVTFDWGSVAEQRLSCHGEI
jgi:hypothetical protein